MNDDTLRGDRRHHERRVWARRTSRAGWPGKHPGKTPGAPCSGPCCGNPRRWYDDVTPQEQRATLDSVSALVDDARDDAEARAAVRDTGERQRAGRR